MKFKVGDKVATPRDGGGKITMIGPLDRVYIKYEVLIDEPNFYTTRFGYPLTLYFRESELRVLSDDQNATKIAKNSDI